MTTEQELLQRAANEIKSLRQSNQLMNARLSTFDSIMQVLNSQTPTNNQGVSKDIVWDIQKLISDSESKKED